MGKFVVAGEEYDLCGWAQIASALLYSVRRVLQLHRAAPMPIHRYGGRVFARQSEISAWLANTGLSVHPAASVRRVA